MDIIHSHQDYQEQYRNSVENPEKFWGRNYPVIFVWRRKWDKVLEWDFAKPEVVLWWQA